MRRGLTEVLGMECPLAPGGTWVARKPDFLLFIRAAELSAAVSQHGLHALVGIQTLEKLAGCFMSDKYKDTTAVSSMLTEFLKLMHMLKFIDGLDQAAYNQCLEVLLKTPLIRQVETTPSRRVDGLNTTVCL